MIVAIPVNDPNAFLSERWTQRRKGSLALGFAAANYIEPVPIIGFLSTSVLQSD